MQFLGTCAADGMPNPLCSCKICQDARKNPRHQRFRSMFLVDEKNLIDCGPDFNASCMKFNLDLSTLENVFITHTHEDHFCTSNSGLLHMSASRNTVPLDIYLSEGGYKMTLELREAMGSKFTYFDAVGDFDKGIVRLHPVKIGEYFEKGGYRIMAVETTHRVSQWERAINYLFEKDGQKLLYACDTGYYTPESIELLRGKQVDTLVMECTWGNRTDRSTSSHLNCEAFLDMLDILLDAQIIHSDTKIFATHINHKHDLNHTELQAWFDQHSKLPVVVAYDGLIVE